MAYIEFMFFIVPCYHSLLLGISVGRVRFSQLFSRILVFCFCVVFWALAADFFKVAFVFSLLSLAYVT